MAIKKILIYMILLIVPGLLAQTRHEFKVKYFVKKGKVLIRLSPDTRESLELLKNNSIKITRYEINQNQISNPKILDSNFRAYWIADTAKWMPLFRKNKKAAFVYSVLYGKSEIKNNPQQNSAFEKNKFNMLRLSCDFDKDLAKASGMFFLDSTIDNNKIYFYKLEVFVSKNKFDQLNSFRVDASVLSLNKPILDLSCKFGNNKIRLVWDASKYFEDFSGYIVEKSEDSIQFKQLNNTPIVFLHDNYEGNQLSYQEKPGQTNKKIYYRIRGINFFGEVSDPSNTVSVFDSPKINGKIDTLFFKSSTCVIKWSVPENGALKKAVLMRSDRDDGKYQPIFETKNEVQFIDNNPLPINYYKLLVVNLNNDTSISMTRRIFQLDSIPPSVPHIISAVADKSGKIKLTWSKINESDLQGYVLFKANKITDEFVQVNLKFIKDTSYIDQYTLKSLTKHLFYTVAAVDKNFNTSARSKVFEAKLIDSIRPSEPILKSAIPGQQGVAVNFIRSSSSDVFKHILIRRDIKKKSEEEIAIIEEKDTINRVLDSSAQKGTVYGYSIRAIDYSGNFTDSRTVNISNETGFREKISFSDYKIDRTLKNITLTWTYHEKEIEKFILYRAKENEQLTIIKTLNGETLSWTDRTLNIGNNYEYRLKAVLLNGAESIISEPLKVTY